MKDFLEKYKKVLIIVLIVLLVSGLLTGTYFLFLKDGNLFGKNGIETNNSEIAEEEKEVTPKPELTLVDSDVALQATFEVAQGWTNDFKLETCGAIPTSIVYTDITYDWLGAEEGLYSSWMCTYVSKVKNASLVITYEDDELGYDYEDTVDGGDYGYLTYNELPLTDFDRLIKTSELYEQVKDDMSDDTYLAMYLGNTTDYGFVWKVEERSKTEVDEYDINIIVKTSVFDPYTGALKATTEEEIY